MRTARAERIGVMGGTFDPIHYGHLLAASEALRAADLHRVIFVPAGRPWQKADSGVTDPELRYLMTVLATSSHPDFCVSRVDVDRPGPTYTVDTLRDLRREHPHAEFSFITGADALAHIFSWKNHEELMTLASFIAIPRPGHALDRSLLPADRVRFLSIPGVDISSTDARARVRAGLSLRYLTPESVVDFIAKNGLYRD
ncbi:MAG: nicotinate-nucleotide adenylyltransferase [Angustibacter sp.]